MEEVAPIQGDLQSQAMPALWRLGAGTVERVRSELPARSRGAYRGLGPGELDGIAGLARQASRKRPR